MTRQTPERAKETRAKAWKTRRTKYGQTGHARCYHQFKGNTARIRRMEDALIELYQCAVLSEGQVCQMTGLDRITVRTRADSMVAR